MVVSAVDLFCRTGGMTSGLENAGISVEAGFDFDDSGAYAYERNNTAEFVECDVLTPETDTPTIITETLDSEADKTLIAGSIPAQPFSTQHDEAEGSKPNPYSLLSDFGSIVEAVVPDFVVMVIEPPARTTSVYDAFIDQLTECGYTCNDSDDRRLYGPEFEMPQERRENVVLAALEGSLELGSPPIQDSEEFRTVKDVIDDLPTLAAGERDHTDPLHRALDMSSINIERIQQSQPGGTLNDWDEELLPVSHKKDSGNSFVSNFGRMAPDAPAPTITTQFYNYGSGRFGHYDTDQNRALSLREGAMIQTFDREYEFAPSIEEHDITQLGRLIGNAVPPKVSEFIGNRIHSISANTDNHHSEDM